MKMINKPAVYLSYAQLAQELHQRKWLMVGFGRINANGWLWSTK